MAQISFLKRSELITFILLAITAFLVWRASSVIFVVFGGFLLGVVGGKIISWITSGTKLPWKINFLIFLFILIIVFGGLGLLLFEQVSGGFGEFASQSGESFSLLEGLLTKYGIIIDENTRGQILSLIGQGIIGGSFNLFISLGGLIIGFFLMIAIGIFYMYDPRVYDSSFMAAFSSKNARKGFEAAKIELQRWTIGIVGSMFVVGVLTLIGLFILGMPFPFTLALIAALLTFIPNLGPIMSVVPAVLVALSENPVLAVDVIFLYVIVQLVESNLITPLIQERMISVQPAFFLVIQALFGVLFGFFGLLFAVPIAIAARAFILTSHPEFSKRYHEEMKRSSNHERYRSKVLKREVFY